MTAYIAKPVRLTRGPHELHSVHDFGPSADPATCQPHTPCCGHGTCVLGECKCEAGYHDEACARYEGVAP